jgi:hypothetical protein
MTVYKANNKLKFSKFVIGTAVQTVIGAETFTGSGLDDCTVSTVSGSNVCIPADFTLVVQIDGNGTPDTYKYSIDGGSNWYATGINCATSTTAVIAYGLSVTFGATTGHTIGDNWSYPIYAFKSHRPDLMASPYARWGRAVLPTFEPVGVDLQENKNTGSMHPRDVSISGIRTGLSIELEKATFEDIYNLYGWLLGSTTALYTGVDLIGSITSADMVPDYDVYEMETRCVGFRTGKDAIYHRLYGMAPGSINITLPTTEGGFGRLSTNLIGIGKHDTYPGAPEEIAGTLGDTYLTLSANPRYSGTANATKSIRQVWAIKTSDNAKYNVTVSGIGGPTFTTRLNITAPVADSSDACTYYVVYVKASEVTSSTWPDNIDDTNEPTELLPIKSTHLTRFAIGGTVSGTAGTSEVVTGGRRIRCDLEGDIQINIDAQPYVKVCADGAADNYANMILTEGPRYTVSFGHQIMDALYQYMAENPDYELSGFPIEIVYTRSDAAVMTIIFPKCKLTSANTQDMGGRAGVNLQPVVLDDGTYAPMILQFA